MIALIIPRLSIEYNTFSSSIWNGFLKRYGENRTKNIVTALGKPVNNFSVRVTLTKTNRERMIEKLSELNWHAFPHPILEEILLVKTKGPKAIRYEKNYPRIIIDKKAAENVYTGSDLFGPGILQVPKFNKEDFVSLLSPLNQIVAIGKAKTDSKNPRRKGTAVKNIESFFEVPSLYNLGLIDSGECYGQSIPAAYVGHVLDPLPNDKIVDLCAAPGGKTTSAAILSNNKSEIIAFDRSKKRMNKMKNSIKNQNLKNIRTINADSIEYFKQHTIKADKVIVDPSCTAIGVRPKLYDETSLRDVYNSSNYQKSFLWLAEKIVRKNGIITYSTCTITQEENEKVIAYGVKELGLKLVKPDILLGTKGEDTDDGLELDYMRRFYPDIHDSQGFFVAKLKK